jgi:hypothetical protein
LALSAITTAGLASGTATCLTTLFACVMGINLAVRKFAGTDTLVGFTALGETVVLCRTLLI